MKLEIECTWNEKRNKAKQVIRFDYRPKSLFCLPDEKIKLMQTLTRKASQEGPSTLDELKTIKIQHPNSLYANFLYYQTLAFFEYHEESEELLSELQDRFPEEVLTKCLVSNLLLKDKKYDKFSAFFQKTEVLKGIFSKRKLFFYEEALFFHSLWANYFEGVKNEIQFEKHSRFIFLILNTLQSFQLVKH